MPIPHPQPERVKKSIRLQKETIADVEKAAEKLNLNTSRAVEKLIQWGLQHVNDYTADIDIGIQSVFVEQSVSRALNRYLKILSQTTIAANEAKEMAQQVFFTQLRQLADDLKDPTEVRPALALDGRNPLHSALHELYIQRKRRGRNRAVRELKSAIDIDAWQTMLARMEGSEA